MFLLIRPFMGLIIRLGLDLRTSPYVANMEEEAPRWFSYGQWLSELKSWRACEEDLGAAS